MQVHAWMTNTTAAEIMTRDVVTLKPADTLADAAKTFLREQISGAPVVDDSGRCVGVLSASDFLSADEKAEEDWQSAFSQFWDSNLALPAGYYANKLEQVKDKFGPAAEQPIERFMTADLVSVSGDTPLSTVVQKMIEAHVHRLLVLTRGNSDLEGLISTMDILAALLRAGAQTNVEDS